MADEVIVAACLYRARCVLEENMLKLALGHPITIIGSAEYEPILPEQACPPHDPLHVRYSHLFSMVWERTLSGTNVLDVILFCANL